MSQVTLLQGWTQILVDNHSPSLWPFAPNILFTGTSDLLLPKPAFPSTPLWLCTSSFPSTIFCLTSAALLHQGTFYSPSKIQLTWHLLCETFAGPALCSKNTLFINLLKHPSVRNEIVERQLPWWRLLTLQIAPSTMPVAWQVLNKETSSAWKRAIIRVRVRPILLIFLLYPLMSCTEGVHS